MLLHRRICLLLRFLVAANSAVWQVTLWSHRCWEACPLLTPWASPMHFTMAGLLTTPVAGMVGVKVLIREPEDCLQA